MENNTGRKVCGGNLEKVQRKITNMLFLIVKNSIKFKANKV